MTPLLKMHTLGHDFVPESIHAGGLRYHGMSPLLSHIYELGLIEAEAIGQVECFERGGVRPCRGDHPRTRADPCHRIGRPGGAPGKETGEEKVILTALCGHGHFDMAAYDDFLHGRLKDFEYPEEKVHEAMERIPEVAGV